MTSYENDNTRWEAYQFSDPFATDAFTCLNTLTRIVCRPNCDFYPKCEAKQDVQFYDYIHSIKQNNYKLCNHCDPSSPKTALNLELIKMTIHSINHSIGFTKDSNDLKRRAYSVSSLSTGDSPNKGERQLSRNESEHFKLVELACRHIAAAAIDNLTKQQLHMSSTEDVTKKKKRGGVLGFKELAVKSKLSAWHFHRVFKSVTGLTPKSYGDRCWEFIKSRDRPQTSRQQHHRANTESHYFRSISGDLYTTNAAPAHNLRRKSEHLSPLDVDNDTLNDTSMRTRKKRKVSIDDTEFKEPYINTNLTHNNSSATSSFNSSTSLSSGSISSNTSSCMSVPLTADTHSTSISSLDAPLTEQFDFNNSILHTGDLNKNSLDISNGAGGRHQTIDLGALGNVNYNEFNTKLMSPALPTFMPFETELPLQTPPTHQDTSFQQFAQPKLQAQRVQPQSYPQKLVPTLSTKANPPTPQTVLLNQQRIQEQPIISNATTQQQSSLTSTPTIPNAVKIEESQMPTLQAFTPDQIFDQETSEQHPASVLSEPDLTLKSEYDLYSSLSQCNGEINDNLMNSAYLIDYQKVDGGVGDFGSCYDVNDALLNSAYFVDHQKVNAGVGDYNSCFLDVANSMNLVHY